MIGALSRYPSFASLAAAFVTGVALWLTRASFDVAGTADRWVRVVMLPGLAELAGLITLALLLAAGVASIVRRREANDRFWSREAADTLLPLFALTLLILPFLPWLADWLPALRLLAGPGRVLLWIVVLGQVGWILVARQSQAKTTPRRPAEAGHHVPGYPPYLVQVVVFGASLATYYTANSRLRGEDEVEWTWLIVAAAVAAVIWLFGYAITKSLSAASFGWAAVCLTAPFVLNTTRFADSISEVYAIVRQVSAANLPDGFANVPALLFDQEFGVFPYAPILIAGVVGLAAMMWQPGQRVLAACLAAAIVTILVMAGTRDPWWTRSMMPGGTVQDMLSLLAVPIASLYARTTGQPLRRAALQMLLLASVGLTFVLVLASDRIPLPQEGDGSSSVLVWMSPSWHLAANAPSFVADAAHAGLGRTAMWLLAFGLVSVLLHRGAGASMGQAGLVATTVAAAAVICVIAVSASGAAQGTFNPEGRVLFPMLEDFNPTARPFGVRYDPLSFVRPAELPTDFSLAAVPGQRRDRQPVRVVLNARFRLPAGEYDVAVTGSQATAPTRNVALGLQIGRDGPPVEIWPLTLTPGVSVRRQFRVPIDSEFVGFRTSREAERAIAELRLRAIQIEPATRRFRTPTVRGAADFGVVRAFFHDGNAYAEREGFWVKGRSTARLTLQKSADTQSSITLAIHSGATPNTVTLATDDWADKLQLTPGATHRVVVPAGSTGSFLPVQITAAAGFVPAEVETGNRDRRLLGAWVAFIHDDISKTSGVP